MFDTILGLPVHPLVVHAVVVLGPLTALIAIAYAVLPRSRRVLRWPLIFGAVITAGTAYVAKESGEALFVRVAGSSAGQNAETMSAIATHEEAGERMFIAALVFLGVVLLAAFLRHRPKASKIEQSEPVEAEGSGTTAVAVKTSQSSLATVMSVLLVLAAIGLLGTSAIAGHSGATAVWGSLIP